MMLDDAGAVPASGPDEGVAAHYGDPVREQRAMTGAGAVIDRSNRGVITISGPDRLSWLHSLTSQHLERLAPGEQAQALILSPQGHIEHHLWVSDDGTRCWVHVEPGTASALAAYLESMRFMLRVEVADCSATHGVLSVAGQAQLKAPLAAAQAGAVLAGDPVGTALITPREAAGQLQAALGVPLAGMWAYEALRIAARAPRVGIDTDERTLPHEAGLIEAAVHLHKGCYRGQETVARVHNLGHPPRRLVLLHLDGSADRLPARGAPLVPGPDGAQAGFAGSSARHYELGPVGLGLVKRTVPVTATLLADGIAAAQEVIVPPDAGANVTVTLARGSVPQPPAGSRRLK